MRRSSADLLSLLQNVHHSTIAEEQEQESKKLASVPQASEDDERQSVATLCI